MITAGVGENHSTIDSVPEALDALNDAQQWCHYINSVCYTMVESQELDRWADDLIIGLMHTAQGIADEIEKASEIITEALRAKEPVSSIDVYDYHEVSNDGED